ncbi:MAG: fatty acid cis/trans isomerase [Gammaproteobacteria bacterium]
MRVLQSPRPRAALISRVTRPLGAALTLAFASLQSAIAAFSGSYVQDIQPLFDRYCVACHACFDAPCQLDLTQAAGVARGASKTPVYDGARIKPVVPSRLGIDAQGVEAWRKRGFFSVLGDDGGPSVLARLLEVSAPRATDPGKPLSPDMELGIKRGDFCPTSAEVDDLLERNPHLSMPFGFPPMPAADRARMLDWVAAGAPLDPVNVEVPAGEAQQVASWEVWLNDPAPRRRLVARWLFEHWAIARLHFDTLDTGHFFRLVRSSTPPGEPVREIASRHYNSDPGGPFHYRFQVQSATRVYKTHIRFALNPRLLKRVDELFSSGGWEVTVLPGYSEQERANPFTTFAAIPARARYRFMLDHAGYFVRSFIRGPVCRGQLATDVIRDQFWVMFQDPDSDPFIVDSAYRAQVDGMLALPGIDDDLLQGAGQWFSTASERERYNGLRQRRLARIAADGATLSDIWDGGGENRNAFLTVFRHHDSATVKRGWLGQQPWTLWWMDFPLFERSYYNLVVNFDVFGNVSHQGQIRLYFDLIRNESEQNFLRLLPARRRQAVLDAWYAGTGKLKLWTTYHRIDTQRPSAVVMGESGPESEPVPRSAEAVKQRLVKLLLERFAPVNGGADPINRPTAGDGAVDATSVEARLSALTGRTAERLPVIRQLPEASLLWITGGEDGDQLYTLLRNRRHSNVAFVLGESLRLQPDKDTLSVVPGLATGYPNYIFTVSARDLRAFVAAMSGPDMDERNRFIESVIEPWGLRRSDARFWDRFHAIADHLRELDPLEAGILDINRYVDYHPERALRIEALKDLQAPEFQLPDLKVERLFRGQ